MAYDYCYYGGHGYGRYPWSKEVTERGDHHFVYHEKWKSISSKHGVLSFIYYI